MFDNADESAVLEGTAEFKHAEIAHATIRTLPASFDTKATFFAGILATTMFFQYSEIGGATGLQLSHATAQPPLKLALYAFFLLALLTIGCCFLVVVARTGGNKTLLMSYVSFAYRKNASEVVREFRTYDANRSTEAIVRHCHELSCLCAAKAFWLRIGLIIGALALITFVVIQIFGLTNIVPALGFASLA